MSSPSNPTTPPVIHPQNAAVSAEAIAAAAQLRSSRATVLKSAAQLSAEHDRRQQFRRLIDPGIIRPNSKKQAFSSLKTLLTIADNLLRDPENPKYKQFKPTNTVIQRELMNPKGAIEYAIEMGFKPQVTDLQSYYVHDFRRMEDLRIGATLLRERIDLETEKMERVALAKANEKANAAMQAERVKLAFMDDRQTKEMRDEMEKQQMLARAAARANPGTSTIVAAPASRLDGVEVNGSGIESEPDSDAENLPPPYVH